MSKATKSRPRQQKSQPKRPLILKRGLTSEEVSECMDRGILEEERKETGRILKVATERIAELRGNIGRTTDLATSGLLAEELEREVSLTHECRAYLDELVQQWRRLERGLLKQAA